MKRVLTGMALACSLLVAACNPYYGQNTDYRFGDTNEYYTETGTIRSMVPTRVIGNNGGQVVGGWTGAIVGGILGSMVGRGPGQVLAATAGAIGGGIAGSAIGASADGEPGYRVMVETDKGSAMEIVTRTTQDLQPGMRVRVYIGQYQSVIEPLR